MQRVSVLLFAALLLPFALHAQVAAQVQDAKDAIDRKEYVRAVNILSEEVAQRPSADAYLYLGIAYGHQREFVKAEETLTQGARQFPTDARFHNELAGVYLATNDVEKARDALHNALTADSDNAYASDLLANIDMSEGEVQTALRAWNRSGRPIVDDILNNGFLTPEHWTINKAIAFRPAGALQYSGWRTTERRLFESGIFSNVGLEVQPTPIPDHYDANIRTSIRTNSFTDFLFNAFKGAPYKTTYFNLWNLGDSGLNISSMFRWEPNRRRGELGFKVPAPLPGLLFVEGTGIWRSELWDVPGSPFRFKSTGGRIILRAIPHYRFEAGAGFEYRNRAGYDSRNFGRLVSEISIRITDTGTYQNRLHTEGYATNLYRGGAAELNNRVTLSKATATQLNFTLRGGTSRGPVPVEDLFLLGIDIQGQIPSQNLLRGHTTTENGSYGRSPMGKQFALINTEIERRISVLPLFGTFNLPFIVVKGEVFLDAAKTSRGGKLLVDTGAGVKFETPTHALNLIYGRSLRDGQQVFAAYVEKRWW